MKIARRLCQGAFWSIVAGCFLMACAGCTRMFYRKSADREVSDLLREKDVFPQWKIEQMHVYADKRSRFADPHDPDHPPMPPDDEAAWKVSPHPQKPGKPGVSKAHGTAYLEMIKSWDAANRTAEESSGKAVKKITGPTGKSKTPIQEHFDLLRGPDKGFLLTLEQTVELGVINSPQYQTFREQLYLSALPVTQQRFSYSYQWAAISDFIRQWAGPTAPDGATNNWTGASSIGLNKLFSTGALLTADFANTTALDLGKHGWTSTSTIGVNLVQPLLQGGGKAVTLEPLTQAERNLFYSIRAFSRFREQYYVAVAIGSGLPNSLSSAAGGGTGTSSSAILAALGIASTDVSGGAVGYLSTLYRQCDLVCDRKLVRDLERALLLYEAYQEGGFFAPLQVDQVRSTLLNARNTVLSDEQFMTNALDQFKLALGLPANLPLLLDDASARPITQQLDQYYSVIANSEAAGKLVEAATNPFIPKGEALSSEKLREELLRIFTVEELTQGTDFSKKIPDSWKAISNLDNDKLQTELENLGKKRRDLLDLRTKAPLSLKDEEELRRIGRNIDLVKLEKTLRTYKARPWEKLEKEDKRRERDRITAFREVGQKAKDVLVWARNERFDEVHRRWPVVPPTVLEGLEVLDVDAALAQQVAVQAALENRFDLMNARAQVVDAWRQVRVTANALMGAINVGYNLQSTTPTSGMHPFAFSSASTSQQVSLNFQLPLNRIKERNAYRAALINYQQARRSLISLEDSIAAQVRFDVRQLRLFAENYKNQQEAIRALYSQVESALEVIVAPADPDQLKGTAGQAAAAALTNQYLGALSQLNGAQSKLYDVWLSFLATRMQLFVDLERLPLDERGIWTDPMGLGAQVPAGKETALSAKRTGISGDVADATAIPLVFIDHPFANTRLANDRPAPNALQRNDVPLTTSTPIRAGFGMPR